MANPEDNGASVASGNRPAFGYTLILLWFYLFIMINLAYLSSVRIVLTLVALICDLSFLHMLNLVAQFIMIYILVLIWKLPNIPTCLYGHHGPYELANKTTRDEPLLTDCPNWTHELSVGVADYPTLEFEPSEKSTRNKHLELTHTDRPT
jgi:hypothetical protein